MTSLQLPQRRDPRVEIIEERNDGYAGSYKGLFLIVSTERKEDGRLWTHASLSRSDRGIPTYDDLRTLKELAFGPDRTAVQIFPPDDQHIDIAGRLPNPVQVLHLWGPQDTGYFLPDMLEGGRSL